MDTSQLNLGILLDVYFHCSLSLYTVILLRLRLLSFCRCVRGCGVVGRRATTVAWLLGVSVANNNKIQGIQVSLLKVPSITREHRFCTNVQADTCPRCGFACSGDVWDACCTPPACATATSISMARRAFPLIPEDSSESASRCGEAVGPGLNSAGLVPFTRPP